MSRHHRKCAAAPELYEALRIARFGLACPTCQNGRGVTTINGELDECPTCHGEGREPYAVQKADAALAKARGE